MVEVGEKIRSNSFIVLKTEHGLVGRLNPALGFYVSICRYNFYLLENSLFFNIVKEAGAAHQILKFSLDILGLGF